MAAFTVRSATADDLNYLRSNFAQSYRHSAYCGETSTDVLRTLLDPLLASWTTLIASPTGDPAFIVGWLLYRDPKAVGWIHVRPGVRRRGIAGTLLQHAGITKGEISTPFMPSKLEGADGSFLNIARSHGYELRWRPYQPLQVALDDARALAEVL